MCLVCENKVDETTTELTICHNAYYFQIENLSCFNCLEKLDCSNHWDILTLPLFPNLRELICFNCGNLRTLPSFPNLQILNCWGCYYLEEIPNLPNLETLDCSRCMLCLRRWPKILPKLQILKCCHYISVQCISHMPNLKKLKCGHGIWNSDLHPHPPLCINNINLVCIPYCLIQLQKRTRNWIKIKHNTKNKYLSLPTVLKQLV